MDFKKLALKCVECHSKPLKKIELPSTKILSKNSCENEPNVEIYLKNIEKALDFLRVDRKCARSRGEWSDTKKLCKVTKLTGLLLKNFGYQDKNGIFFTPEETLFLLEQNKLELMCEGRYLSVCETYDKVLQICPPQKYKVYKKLVSLGFKLMNNHAIRKFYSRIKKKGIKRKHQCSEEENEAESVVTNPDLNDQENELLKSLRSKGPKLIESENLSIEPDYFGFLPDSNCKDKHNFNLYIRDNFSFSDFVNSGGIPNIIAISSDDSVSFYKFPNVNIPILT